MGSAQSASPSAFTHGRNHGADCGGSRTSAKHSTSSCCELLSLSDQQQSAHTCRQQQQQQWHKVNGSAGPGDESRRQRGRGRHQGRRARVKAAVAAKTGKIKAPAKELYNGHSNGNGNNNSNNFGNDNKSGSNNERSSFKKVQSAKGSCAKLCKSIGDKLRSPKLVSAAHSLVSGCSTTEDCNIANSASTCQTDEAAQVHTCDSAAVASDEAINNASDVDASAAKLVVCRPPQLQHRSPAPTMRANNNDCVGGAISTTTTSKPGPSMTAATSATAAASATATIKRRARGIQRHLSSGSNSASYIAKRLPALMVAGAKRRRKSLAASLALVSSVATAATSSGADKESESSNNLSTTVKSGHQARRATSRADHNHHHRDRDVPTIENSDVFIYPTTYRDQNECQKCERDNKICNCNLIEPPTLTSSSLSSKGLCDDEEHNADGAGERKQRDYQICSSARDPVEESCAQVTADISCESANTNATNTNDFGATDSTKATCTTTKNLSGPEIVDESVFDRCRQSYNCDYGRDCSAQSQQDNKRCSKRQAAPKRQSSFNFESQSMLLEQQRRMSSSNNSPATKSTSLLMAIGTANPFIDVTGASSLRQQRPAADEGEFKSQRVQDGTHIGECDNRNSVAAVQAAYRENGTITGAANTTVTTTASLLLPPRKRSDYSSFNNHLAEYSPILDSAKDFIDTINSEVQLARATTTCPVNGSGLSKDSGSAPNNLIVNVTSSSGIITCATSTVALQPIATIATVNTTAAANRIQAADDLILASVESSKLAPKIETQLVSVSTNLLSSTGPPAGVATLPACSQSFASTTAASVSTSALASASKADVPVAPLAHSSSLNANQVESSAMTKSGTDSPKKRSIFDGASKDEILEYLEFARERVPEVLIAADEVMVINDNELIVVNRLEPGSPATPIQIVEQQSGARGGPGADIVVAPAVASPATVCSIASVVTQPAEVKIIPSMATSTAATATVLPIEEEEPIVPPSSLGQKLEQLYQASREVNMHFAPGRPINSSVPTSSTALVEVVNQDATSLVDRHLMTTGVMPQIAITCAQPLVPVHPHPLTTTTAGMAAAAANEPSAISFDDDMVAHRSVACSGAGQLRTSEGANIDINNIASKTEQEELAGFERANSLIEEEASILAAIKSLDLNYSFDKEAHLFRSPMCPLVQQPLPLPPLMPPSPPQVNGNRQNSMPALGQASTKVRASNRGGAKLAARCRNYQRKTGAFTIMNRVHRRRKSVPNGLRQSIDGTIQMVLLQQKHYSTRQRSSSSTSSSSSSSSLSSSSPAAAPVVKESRRVPPLNAAEPMSRSTTSSLSLSTSSSSSSAVVIDSPNQGNDSNCSVISNLYASSSLSCSSPYLALATTASLSMHTPATTNLTSVSTCATNHGQVLMIDTNPITKSLMRQQQHQTSIIGPSDDTSTSASYCSGSRNAQSAPIHINASSFTQSPYLTTSATDKNVGTTSFDYCIDQLKSSLPSTLSPEPMNSYGSPCGSPQPLVDRGDSGFGPELHNSLNLAQLQLAASPIKLMSTQTESKRDFDSSRKELTAAATNNWLNARMDDAQGVKLDVIDELVQKSAPSSIKSTSSGYSAAAAAAAKKKFSATSNILRFTPSLGSASSNLLSPTNLLSKSSYCHYAILIRLNNYLAAGFQSNDMDRIKLESQCIDCDQFVVIDPVAVSKLIRKIHSLLGLSHPPDASSSDVSAESTDKGEGGEQQSPPVEPTLDQIDKAYIAAINELPLCEACAKRRAERKEIISEFAETEFKYGRDLKIILDEFYRPMQIAGLLSKDQINGIFLNLEELIMAHCRFFDRLSSAINEAQALGDKDLTIVNVGKIFVESAEMLHTFESYCIRQGSAACLLARLAKERELLRIFLRVSQMENTLLRRMNLAAFLMVPVQRVTRYPLLLNRLYKVTPYHHRDREALRDAQLKVELHLEHINQQTKGIGATNKIWRRISNLSTPASTRRCLLNTEDISYMKLRKAALDILKWHRDEAQFIHSGVLSFSPLNEYLVRQKTKSLRFIMAHALLIVLGKPNWKYRPDLVKSSLDNKLTTPTPGGNGIKEAALLLFREKNSRFVLCREPLILSNSVLSNDCSHFNSECPSSQSQHSSGNSNNSINQTCSTNNSNNISAADSNSSSISTTHLLRQTSSSKTAPTTTAATTSTTTTTPSTTSASSDHQTGTTCVNGNNGLNQYCRKSLPGRLQVKEIDMKPINAFETAHSCFTSSMQIDPTPVRSNTTAICDTTTSRSFESQSVRTNSDTASESECAALVASITGSNSHSHSHSNSHSHSHSRCDTISVSSLKNSPDDIAIASHSVTPPLSMIASQPNDQVSLHQAPRCNSLVTQLSRSPITTMNSTTNLIKSPSATSSNLAIINSLITKVNNYHKHVYSASKQAQQQQLSLRAAASGGGGCGSNSGSKSSSPARKPTSDSKGHQRSEQPGSEHSRSGSNNIANNNNINDSNTNQSEASVVGSDQLPQHSQFGSICKSNELQAHSLRSLACNNYSSTDNSTNMQSQSQTQQQQTFRQHYNHHFFHNHQAYGDYEESFEIHDRLSKESLLLRADTPLKTRYWLQMLRYHAKDLGQWRFRRNGLANIMIMHQE